MTDPCESCRVPADLQWQSEECQECPYNEELWRVPSPDWKLQLDELEAAKRELFDPLEDS